MRAKEKLGHWIIAGLSLFKVKWPEEHVRTSVIVATLFNVLGMPIQLLIFRSDKMLPRWPIYLSMAAGVCILLYALFGRINGRVRYLGGLFVANAGFVSFALFSIYAHLVVAHPTMMPFQASKLGALVAALLAPGILSGVAAIFIHVVSAIAQWGCFPADVKIIVGEQEPWATIAFGMAGLFVLAYRLRTRFIEEQIFRARTEVESTRRLAQVFLEIRDMMNTPLQSIEISTRLLGRAHQDRREVLAQLQQSCNRLREINELLKKYEDKLEWKPARGGLT